MESTDFFTLALDACVLIGGAIAAGVGVGRLRRGPVTAREAVEWRHRVRKQGLDAEEGMRPRLTDAFVLAWRRSDAGQLLGGGLGAMIGGILVLAFVLTASHDQLLQFGALAFSLTFAGAALCYCIGALAGLASIDRDQSGSHARGRIRAYRSWIATAFLAAILLSVIVFSVHTISALLALKPPPPTPGEFPPPYVWVFIVVPCWLVIQALVAEITARKIAALPPLRLPMESALGAPADEKLRSLAIRQIYMTMGIFMLQTGEILAGYSMSSYLGEAFNDFSLNVSLAFGVSIFLYLVLVTLGPKPREALARWRHTREAFSQPG